MAINKGTQYISYPNTIPVDTATGTNQPLSEALDKRLSCFPTVPAMDSAAELDVGVLVKTSGYHTAGFGGNIYEIVPAGTATADGGSYIDLSASGLQAKGLFPNGIDVFQFGATNDMQDSSAALNAASDYAGSVGVGEVYIPANIAVSQFTHPRGITYVGRGRQSYGEVSLGNPTTIHLLAGPGQWGWILEGFAMVGGLRNISLQGDWTNHGIYTSATTREFDLENVSVKNVDNGIKTIDTYVGSFNRVSVTCRGVGIDWYGGGTTMDFSHTIVQGDKIADIRAKIGYRFTGEGFSDYLMVSSQINVGAAQHVEKIIDISGNMRLIIDALNCEGFNDCAFNIHDTLKCKLDIRLPHLAASGASGGGFSPIFRFSGTISDQTEINIGLVSAYDEVDVTGTVKFIEDGPGLVADGKIRLHWDLYDSVIVQTDTLSRRMLYPLKDISNLGGEFLYLKGLSSYDVSFDRLQGLWENHIGHQFAVNRLNKIPTTSTEGVGQIFAVYSAGIEGGIPNVSYISVDSVTGSYSQTDITGSHSITADFPNSKLVVSPASIFQTIIFSPCC